MSHSGTCRTVIELIPRLPQDPWDKVHEHREKTCTPPWNVFSCHCKHCKKSGPRLPERNAKLQSQTETCHQILANIFKILQTSNNSNCTVSLRHNASQAAISQVCSVAQSWLKSLWLGRLGTLSSYVIKICQNQFQAMRPSSQVPFGTANLPTALKKCQSSRRFV